MKAILLLILNSILLAGGILLIIFCCLLYNTWWPLFIVLAVAMAVAFPVLMSGCQFDSSESSSLFADDDHDGIAVLSWIATGVLVIIAYAIPVELFRAQLVPAGGVYFSAGGGTIVLLAILLFCRNM